MTQIIEAKNGRITDEMYRISRMENIAVEDLRKLISTGQAVIIKNSSRKNVTPVAIGSGLKTKIMASVGVINRQTTLENEIDKTIVAKHSKADMLLDTSINGYTDDARLAFLNSSNLPLGSEPILQTAFKTAFQLNVEDVIEENIFSDIEKNCSDGVDFIVVHCGLTKSIVDKISLDKYSSPVSKGGIVTACAIKRSGLENPLYAKFDILLEIAKQYDVTLLLATSLRQSFAGKVNKKSIMETAINAELAKKAFDYGVQSIVEAGGNMFVDKIPYSIKTAKELTNNSPLFAMSLTTCNNSTGYNSIANAIGYSIGALSGLNLLCATSDSYSYSNAAKLKEAIISARIAGHCADISNGIKPSILSDSSAANAFIDCNLEEYSKNSIDISMESDLNNFDFSTQAYFRERFIEYFKD